jgi:lincosamide nucleotidyltransferase A/C/D/E
MRSTDVVVLYGLLEDAGAHVWIMGGWGVDALLGRQSRTHHDLDLLVEVRNLERLRRCLIDLGFELRYVWSDEVRWVRDDAWTSPLEQPTAFVYGHRDGREVDIHVIRRTGDGAVEMLWDAPYAFTVDGLDATGRIAGHEVRCLSRETQQQAHAGYELPANHLQDLKLLDALP